MGIEKKHEELIEKSYIELEALQNEVTLLADMRKNLETLISTNNQLPVIFEEKFKKIIELTEKYSLSLGLAAKTYLDGNDILFASCLSELSTKLKEFENEISRLANTDFAKLFNDLQKVFIEQTREDLAIEIQRFEPITSDLQTKIGEFKKQIDRLAKIDLDTHFDKLQKTLSDIFGAINAINLTLTNVIQTLTGIVQALGTIQASLDNNHIEVKQLLNTFSVSTKKHLLEQDLLATSNVEFLDAKMRNLGEQNQLLIKEVKTNRIILVVMLLIILIFVIYFSFKS